MPVKLGDREYRAMATVMGPAPEDVARLIEGDYYAEGNATSFNVPYQLYPGIMEQIDRHALDEADLSDVIMQYDHEGRVLARTRNNTLALDPNASTFRIGADLSKGESARQLHEEIINGLVDRMSWAFIVLEEKWETLPSGDELRTILKVGKVYDVSAVSIPAFEEGTSISARADDVVTRSVQSLVDGVIDERRRSERARKARVLSLRTRLP